MFPPRFCTAFLGDAEQKKITQPSTRRWVLGFKGGFLTLGSSFFQPSHPLTENSGVFWKLSPITVAGAASAFHGLPCTLNPRTQLSKKLRDCIFSPDSRLVKDFGWIGNIFTLIFSYKILNINLSAFFINNSGLSPTECYEQINEERAAEDGSDNSHRKLCWGKNGSCDRVTQS